MPAEAPVLEPQFSTPDQQRGASVLGMWVFLATEVLLFGGIVTAFLATRVFYPHDFERAAGRLNVLIGGVNTVVLLASSLAMALAVHAARTANRRTMLVCFGLTALLGAGFLGLKGYEYYTDWRDGIVPRTGRFHPGDVNADRLTLFMMFYFVLTGLHAVHLSIGLGLVGWLAARTARGELPRPGATATEVIGLYWHFVDVVWVFLLPVLYLSGHHAFADLHF
ncbi:MAG TPA: cytochrome c oxidase subunit 3 [Urbifossiella sp.]|jgi:cytochrome c oxidase subunit 3|nr:cytochrome c oxidase subunit 3 [Urbifossiella sp.]